jgi:hypothetical protein
VGCNGCGPAMTSLARMVALSAAIATVAACQKAEPEPVMRPASSTVVANDRAVQKMANVNCERELACGNIGRGRRYETPEMCAGTFEREKYSELGFGKCLLGVDYVQLDLCIREIRSEGCSSALYTLDALGACRSSKLCRD